MKLFSHFTGNEQVSRFIYNETGPKGGNDTGPLKVEDIEGLTEAQKTDAEIQAALAKFNAKFQDQDFGVVMKHLREVDPELTAEDIPKLEQYASQIEAKLAPKVADTTGLGLDLPPVDGGNTGDLGLGLPAVAAAEDNGLGLGLPPVDGKDGDDILTGGAAADDLGLGVPTTGDVIPEGDKTEVATFEPDENRCRECAGKVVEGFTDYPDEAQGAVVARLVRMETEYACNVNEIDPEKVKSKCDIVLSRFEKAVSDDAVEADNERREDEAKEDTVEARTEEVEVTEANREKIAALKAKLAADEMGKGQIDAILDDAAAWEEIGKLDEADPERKELEGFKAQLGIVQRELNSVSAITTPNNPQEAAVLQQIVASTPVTWKAESPSVRYEAILTAIDAGNLSDDTKRRAREALGVRLNTPPTIRTGSDVQDALREGRGTETRYRTERVEEPPGSGNYVEKQVPYEVPLEYDEKHPLEVRDGVSAYPTEDGKTRIEAKIGDRTFPFETSGNISGPELGLKVNAFIVNYLMQQKGLAGATNQGVLSENAAIDLDNTGAARGQAYRMAEMSMDYLLGAGRGRDGEILTDQEMKRLDWSYQWFMPEAGTPILSGDGAHGDRDAARVADKLGGNGTDGLFFSASGEVNPENFERAARWINGQFPSGEPSFEALKAYLESGAE